MIDTLRIAFLEPYYGGSHASFADTFCAYTKHQVQLATLPARKWKWRMRGAAMWFTQPDQEWIQVALRGEIDLIFCSDMLSVSDLRALLPAELRSIPIVCYFHENQLSYPIPDDQTRDFQYGMTNITSGLTADAVWFNSQFHLEDFLHEAAALLRKMPDFVPVGAVETIRAKSEVYPPPISLDAYQEPKRGASKNKTILWCHRWEFDKNPEPFFEALLKLDADGYAFDLVLLGEQFRTAPPVFADSWDRLQKHIVHSGFIPNPAEYISMLQRCDLVVSSAIQENFGIAVIEAILAGSQPLLPDRLAYPEVIPVQFHQVCLYPSDDDLYMSLREFLDGRRILNTDQLGALLETAATRFGVQNVVERMDAKLLGLTEKQ